MLLVLPLVFRLDGKPHADWQQFLGRFHPLMVHLPIGLLVLVPVLELCGWLRPPLREAAGFVLGLSVLACIASLVLGYLLAYGAGEAGAGITRHMWGGIALTIVVLLSALIRPAWSAGRVDWSYPSLLFGVMLVLAWTAHQGGSLTHGENYLTEYLPAPFKSQAGNSFYAKQIHPVMDAKCVACHGASKAKGGLRMDTYGALMKGGSDGPVVVAGHPEKSLLIERVMLPREHAKFMPAEGRAPLRPEEVALIKAWIAQGASESASTLVGVAVREKDKPLPQVGDYRGRMEEIAQLSKATGSTLMPVSKNMRDGLILNTVDASKTFGDAQLARLEPLYPYIVEVELGRSGVTDAAFAKLAKFPHLRAIHLEGTSVTGAGIDAILRLPELTYVNLSSTQVTAAAVAPLAASKTVVHLYLYNTPAQPVAVATDAKKVL